MCIRDSTYAELISWRKDSPREYRYRISVNPPQSLQEKSSKAEYTKGAAGRLRPSYIHEMCIRDSAYVGDISLAIIGVCVCSLAVVPGFHLGRGGRRAGVHIDVYKRQR